MKTFLQIRELAKRKPKGDLVSNNKFGKIQVMVYKEKPNLFVTYIDGDRLDGYKTQKEAEKAGKEFVKQYKGMK